jgi:uncharacterized RDD family membrane protein YckC
MSALEAWSRAGFWPRASAFLLDFVVITAIIGLIGVGLASATNGSIRVSNTFVDFRECSRGAKPSELQLPTDFAPNSFVRCTKYLLGIPHDWLLSASEEPQTGPNSTYLQIGPNSTRHWSFSLDIGPNSTQTPGVTVPLDPASQIAKPFYLDFLFPFVMAAYLFLFEWKFGSTAGKRAFGLRVRSCDGMPPRCAQAARRAGLRMILLLSMTAPSMFPMTVDPTKWLIVFIDPPIGYEIASDICWLLTFAFVVNFIITTGRRTLPWHDRWAGTEVVGPHGVRHLPAS